MILSTTVYKVGVVSTENRVHKACIEVARQSTTVYKVGMAYIGIVLWLLVLHTYTR